MGRHSDAVEGSDAVYSRDLAFAPVRALESVLRMVKEGVFNPDASRANFFTGGGNPLIPGTPMPFASQPRAPAIFVAPVVEMDEARAEAPVKHEHLDAQQFGSLIPDAVIENATTSESSASASGSEGADSDDDQKLNNEAGSGVPRPSEAMDVLVRNKASKITHCCPDMLRYAGQIPEAQWEVVAGQVTKCGRNIDERFEIISVIHDWTKKCRVCYKNNRCPKIS